MERVCNKDGEYNVPSRREREWRGLQSLSCLKSFGTAQLYELGGRSEVWGRNVDFGRGEVDIH